MEDVSRLAIPMSEDRTFEVVITLDEKGQVVSQIVHNQEAGAVIRATTTLRGIEDLQTMLAQVISYALLYGIPTGLLQSDNKKKGFGFGK